MSSKDRSIVEKAAPSAIDDTDRAIIAVRTRPLKSENEDYGDVYLGQFVSAVVIADGVGSSPDGNVAARLAVDTFLAGVSDWDHARLQIGLGDLRSLWERSGATISTHFDRNSERYGTGRDVLQTTLVTLVELEDTYFISYLGNGSVWHIRGDFWHFHARRWPWCMSDLMIGHTDLSDDGKEALYGFLGHNGLAVEPHVLAIRKDKQRGEIFILSTDGISSPDQLKSGRDPNGKLWVEVNPHVESLVSNHLLRYFERTLQEDKRNSQALGENLERFLADCTFGDDATVATVVSRLALKRYALTSGST